MITQAQIGTALSAYAAEITKIYDQGKSLTIEHRRKAMIAALTAAAEVGEQDKNWIAKRADIRNSAIERCAQAAEQMQGRPDQVLFSRAELAAAIRALKEDH